MHTVCKSSMKSAVIYLNKKLPCSQIADPLSTASHPHTSTGICFI